ncbi:YdeI/OmpD-associated family protein [Candidatus Saccharibacteria bacterium]|nr:YdeI/OmpD-associated family protein [Candidatus Saccharibacteria bacterium]
MSTNEILSGVAHKLPKDLQSAISANKIVKERWQDLTPLARNEWICWTISVKQQKTREDHIKRTVKEISQGKRRPCCWMGCVHRTDKAINPTQKWILDKKVSKS